MSGSRAGGPRIFYGWWVVAASIVGLSTGPGQFVFGSLGLFIVPLESEFGWNRAEISLALTCFTVALAVCLPVAGWFVDRYGSRPVLLPSMVIVAGLLAIIPLVLGEIWHLWVIFALIGSIGAAANALPYLRTISAWFNRRRGLAIGLAMGGAGSGYAYVPPLVQFMIDHAGWREAYGILAAITVVVAVPIVALVVREHPSDMGLQPDGDDAPIEVGAVQTTRGVSRGTALRTPAFWKLFLLFVMLSMSLYGLLSHLVPMLTDRGMAGQAAALAASTLGITIVFARVIIGYLVDRYFAPFVAFGCFLLAAGGIALLAAGGVGAGAYVAGVLVGLSMGAEIDLLAYLSSRYFGLRAFGEIYGLLFAAFLIGASLGPVAFGAAFELTGSYDQVLGVAVVLVLLAAVLVATLPRYPDPAEWPVEPAGA